VLQTFILIKISVAIVVAELQIPQNLLYCSCVEQFKTVIENVLVIFSFLPTNLLVAL